MESRKSSAGPISTFRSGHVALPATRNRNRVRASSADSAALRSRRFCSHQGLTDQECLIAGCPQPGDVRAILDSTLRHARPHFWDQFRQPESIYDHLEGSQIAVVYPDQVGARVQSRCNSSSSWASQSTSSPMVRLFWPAPSTPLATAPPQSAGSHRPLCPCLQQLKFVHDKIFLQTGQLCAGRRTLQIVQ